MKLEQMTKQELTSINAGSEFSEAVLRLCGFLYECHKKTMETLRELRDQNVEYDSRYSYL